MNRTCFCGDPATHIVNTSEGPRAFCDFHPAYEAAVKEGDS